MFMYKVGVKIQHMLCFDFAIFRPFCLMAPVKASACPKIKTTSNLGFAVIHKRNY